MFLCEAVIEPEKIKINSYNEDKLNKEFKKYKLMFIYKEHINLNGYYDKKNDEIQIFYSNKDSFNEMVHKIQHKHSNKYFEKIVNQINNNEKKFVQLFNTNTSQQIIK